MIDDDSGGEVEHAARLRATIRAEIRAETGRLMRLNDIEDSLCGY